MLAREEVLTGYAVLTSCRHVGDSVYSRGYSRGLAVSYDLSVNGVLKQCIECEGVVPNCSLCSLLNSKYLSQFKQAHTASVLPTDQSFALTVAISMSLTHTLQ